MDPSFPETVKQGPDTGNLALAEIVFKLIFKPSRRWLGVKVQGQQTCWFSGRAFVINSTLVRKVNSLSFGKFDCITFLKVVITNLSQQPPMCGARGGMKLH